MKIRRPKISKKKIFIFSVFILIATIFWFLDALNREYVTEIEYPIELINLPKGVQENQNYPSKITVTIKANGFDIVRKMNISDTLKIDVAKTAIQSKTDKLKYVLSLNDISHKLFSKINNIHVVSIKPQILNFEAIKIYSKTVPVKLNVNFSTANLFMQSGDIQLFPDKIEISGKKNIITKIISVETDLKEYNNLEDTLKTTINLQKSEGVRLSEKYVTVIIPINKFTEGEIIVPITSVNIPKNIKIKTFPNEIKIKYKVSLSKYHSIKKHNFKVIADFSKLKNNESEKIQVELVKFPKHLKSLKLSLEYIDFVIEKTSNK